MTENRMDFFETRYFSLNRTLLISIGLWPYLDLKMQIMRRAFVIFVIFAALFFQVAKVLTSAWSLNLISQILPFLLMCIATLVKYIVYCIKHEKASSKRELATKELLDSLKYSWDSLESKEEAIIMENSFKEGLLFTVYWASTLIYLLLSTMPIILDFLLPLNETRPRHLPFLVECFYDQQKYFYPTLLLMAITAFIIISTLIGTKITSVAHVLHACGIFNIASYKLQHIFDHKEDNTVDDFHSIRKRVFKGVSYQQKAFKLVISINEYYEWIDFCNIIMATIVISFSLYCVRIFIGEWNYMVKTGLIAGCELFTLFVILYPGQMLINCSSLVFQNVCFSEWYNASPRMQKLLLLIIHRSLTPATIIMGKLSTASMDTYGRILQSCLSYFTVLCSFR